MKITYTADKVFELTDGEGKFYGSLGYEGWSSTKAALTTQFAEFYDIIPKGFWSTYIAVEKAGEEIAQMRVNWRGRIIIDFLHTEEEVDFQFRSVGLWTVAYVVEDRFKNTLLTLTPDFNWGKLNYDYIVEINEPTADKVNETMILLAVYCANYLRKKKKAAAAS
jgi:hypothetical protein